MNHFGEKLTAHRVRNTGEDLIEFQKDIDTALGAVGCLEYAFTKKSDDPDCMLTTRAKLKSGVDKETGKQKIEEVWLTRLRYLDHEEHEIEDTEEGFVFHYLTWTKFLGVVGKIECRE
ncbi:MAG: hypothetical protein EHM45_05315 [Desulfobacteraceae bacterium]|nr:MAG: hypothetical protein EHM45_05315 [Desulfobacteraceae bacterium]